MRCGCESACGICVLDAWEHQKGTSADAKYNFDFCICFNPNLCYGVYIPVMERPIAASKLEVSCVTGLPARTAPTFVPSFFVPNLAWMTRAPPGFRVARIP